MSWKSQTTTLPVQSFLTLVQLPVFKQVSFAITLNFCSSAAVSRPLQKPLFLKARRINSIALTEVGNHLSTVGIQNQGSFLQGERVEWTRVSPSIMLCRSPFRSPCSWSGFFAYHVFSQPTSLKWRSCRMSPFLFKANFYCWLQASQFALMAYILCLSIDSVAFPSMLSSPWRPKFSKYETIGSFDRPGR